MANWHKLNKEFNNLMNHFTDEDWKRLRRDRLTEKAKIIEASWIENNKNEQIF